MSSRLARWAIALAAIALINLTLVEAPHAQPPRRNRRPPWYIEPTPETRRKVEELIDDVRDVELTITVRPNISRLIRTKRPISRISITDPTVLDVVQYSPTEYELIGLRRGVTSMSIWYAAPQATMPRNSGSPNHPARETSFRR